MMSCDTKLIGVKYRAIHPGERSRYNLDVVVKHATRFVGDTLYAVHWVSPAHNVPSKGEVSDGVSEVEVAAGKRLDVMNVDVVDGEGLAWKYYSVQEVAVHL